MDLALSPVEDAEDEYLEMFEHSDAAKAAVAKAKAQAEAKAQSERRVAAAE
jgi:hypothetical protein